MKNNPLNFSKAEEARLSQHAEAVARKEHADELHKRGLTPTATDALAEIDPAGQAARKLAADGVEAVRLRRRCMIEGESYKAGDMILPFPSRPLPGFCDSETLARIDPEAFIREGQTITIVQPTMIKGRRYKAGDVLECWPTKPPRGFLAARKILDLLCDGIAEAAPLID